MVAPLCFGWFDEDDDDQPALMVNGTSANTTSLLNCPTPLDDVLSYFNDFYEYLDQTFNPFYEPPPTAPPTLATPVLNTTDLNSTSTTPAPT